MKTALALLACVISTAALAAPPAAPQVTVAATDIRQLEFNWDSVSGAQRYELWFRSAPGAPWAFFGERDARRSPLFRLGVSVHLLNWAQAQYLVKACNSGGCTSSNLVGVNDEKLAAIGYIKPKAPTGHVTFGSHVAVSEDGKTLAVMTGETMGVATNSVVIHVYRKNTATSDWRREARLLPSYVKAITHDGFSGDNLALSADGNLLVLGSWKEPGSRSGVPANAGAVYLFRRTGTTWSIAQTLKGDQEGDWFGFRVDVDDAGRTVAVWRNFNGNNREPGTLEIYRDPVGGSNQFVHDRTLPVPPRLPDGAESLCDRFAMSGDGNTLMRSCIRGTDATYEGSVYFHTGPTFAVNSEIPQSTDNCDLSYDGKTAIIQANNGSDVLRLTNTGWVRDGFLPDFPGVYVSGPQQLKLSRDGLIAAVGKPTEFTYGVGPVYPPYVAGNEDEPNGGVVIHQRKASGWEVRRLVKPGSYPRGFAGWSISLGDNGKLLAVGAPLDPSAATGIDGDREDTSAPNRGAVWLY